MKQVSEIGEAVNRHPHKMELQMLIISALMSLSMEGYKAFEKGVCRRIRAGADTNPYNGDTMPMEHKQWRKGYNAANATLNVPPMVI